MSGAAVVGQVHQEGEGEAGGGCDPLASGKREQTNSNMVLKSVWIWTTVARSSSERSNSVQHPGEPVGRKKDDEGPAEAKGGDKAAAPDAEE